jgi:hypothetical protein
MLCNVGHVSLVRTPCQSLEFQKKNRLSSVHTLLILRYAEKTVLRIRIRGFFDPWIQDGKISDLRSGIRKNIPDHISEKLSVIIFCVKKNKLIFFVADPDPSSSSFFTLFRDPGWKN